MQNKIIINILAISGIFVIFIAFFFNYECIILKTFNIPCVSCGLTRGFKYILDLDFINAIKINLLSIPLFITLSIFYILYLMWLIFKKEYIFKFYNYFVRHYILVIIILFANLIINIVKYTGGIRMEIISIICDMFIVIISSFAIYKYFRNKKDEIKSAATIVYNQLKDFDEYIDNIKAKFNNEGTISDYHLFLINNVLESNAWTLNKHILIKELSQDDNDLINKTYSIIENIEYAKKRILDTFITTNNAKSFALQFQICEMFDSSTNEFNVEEQKEIDNLTNKFNKSTSYFSMRLPFDILKNMVSNYNKVSDTVTLERLKELSYKNKK